MEIAVKKILSIIALFVVGFLCYGNALYNGFVWDDESFVVENSSIRSLNNPASFFYDPRTIAKEEEFSHHVYRPLVALSFAIDYKFWKLNPKFYHLENIIFHILNAALCYILILLLFDNGMLALFTGLIFLVHPAQTEAVTWISGRTNVLFVFFYLLSLIFFVLHCKSRKKTYFFISLALFLFSVFSKEMALTLPLIVVLIILLNKDNSWKRFLYSLPYFLIAVFYIAIRTLLLGRVAQIEPWAPIYERFLTMAKAVIDYFYILFCPLQLCADRAIFIIKSMRNPDAFISLGIVIFVIFSASFLYRKYRTISFSILFFFIALLPALNIIPINIILAERFLYLPSIGFALFVSFLFCLLIGCVKKPVPKSLLYSVFIIIVTLLACRTAIRNADWSCAEIFYKKNLEINPQSARFHYNLGITLVRNNELEPAKEELEKAIGLKNDYTEAYNILGNIYALRGYNNLAIRNFKRAIVTKPNIVSYNCMGISYYEIGDYQKAIDCYKKALALRENYAKAYANLGNAYYKVGDVLNAKASWQRALRIDPSNEIIRSNLKVLEK